MGDAGELVATGGTDNTLRLWDLRSQRCIDVIVVGESSPASVALSGDNNYVASGLFCLRISFTHISTIIFFPCV